jgi:hypothetical protein
MHLNLEGKVVLVTGKQFHNNTAPIERNSI